MIRSICLCLLILCSCKNDSKEKDILHVSVLRGPSVIAFAQLIEDAPELAGKRMVVRVIDSPEYMQALLIRGETDLAVLPMINAANLYNKGVKYALLGCPVWGNLYLVEKKESEAQTPENKVLHVFGAGTTPDIITRYYLQQNRLDYTLNYSFSTPQEVSRGLLGGQIRTAVMAEPFLSILLRKDSAFVVKASLNNPDDLSPGFPQTAIVYAPALQEKRKALDSLLTASCRLAVSQPEKAIAILEKRNLFAPGSLTPESIERCHIHYVPAEAAKDEILDFLRLIEHYEPQAIGGRLPDNGFMPDKP